MTIEPTRPPIRGIVVKAHGDQDRYVIWSNNTESPHAWGNRHEIIGYLGGDRQAGPCPCCGTYLSENDTPAARIARADKNGSSDLSSRDGWWDDEGFVYEQRGILPRAKLWEACLLLGEEREAEVWDLLVPFEDRGEVRRG